MVKKVLNVLRNHLMRLETLRSIKIIFEVFHLKVQIFSYNLIRISKELLREMISDIYDYYRVVIGVFLILAVSFCIL